MNIQQAMTETLKAVTAAADQKARTPFATVRIQTRQGLDLTVSPSGRIYFARFNGHVAAVEAASRPQFTAYRIAAQLAAD